MIWQVEAGLSCAGRVNLEKLSNIACSQKSPVNAVLNMTPNSVYYTSETRHQVAAVHAQSSLRWPIYGVGLNIGKRGCNTSVKT